MADVFFVEDGCDLRALLSQLISSELDVDRLDYLVQDSVFTGAKYGEVDTGWLISHLTRHVDAEDRVCLALDGRALYALDGFLMARFHMFLMVYFHQKSAVYEEMLKRTIAAQQPTWTLPADPAGYARTDDAWLWDWLRRRSDPWARRIIGFNPYKGRYARYAGGGRVGAAHRAPPRRGGDAIARAERGSCSGRPSRRARHYVVDHPVAGPAGLRLQETTGLNRDGLVAPSRASTSRRRMSSGPGILRLRAAARADPPLVNPPRGRRCVALDRDDRLDLRDPP